MNNLTVVAGLTGVLIVLVVVGNAFWEGPEQRYESTREMMDTYVTIIIYHTDEDEAKEIIDDAFSRMEEIIDIANRFNTSTEVYKLNTEGIVENPSPELVEMIQISIDYWDITGGVFDITIMPLLDLWNPYSGAGPYLLFSVNLSHSEALDSASVPEELRTDFSNHQYTLNETPTVIVGDPGREWTLLSGWVEYRISNESDELRVYTEAFWNVNPSKQNEYINDTKQFVGSDKITITSESISLEPGMSITLDGMAKGYIVDAAIKVLEDNGIERALIDAGGDIATLGHKPEGEKWVIGLRNPDDESESIIEFGVSGKAVATSGNYERFFDENESVGHIMDPRTGNSVFLASSATIIADNCTVADILATGIFVLGPVDGIQLVETLPDVEALMLGYDNPQELFPSTGVNRYEIED